MPAADDDAPTTGSPTALARYTRIKAAIGHRVANMARAVRARWKLEAAVAAVAAVAAGLYALPWDALRPWQQGLGAIVGFLALAGAALLNYALMRRRDTRLLAEEADRIRGALHSEIGWMRHESRNALMHINARFSPEQLGHPRNLRQMRVSRLGVLDAYMDQLHKLTPTEARAVLQAYNVVARTNANIERLAQTSEDGDLSRTAAGHSAFDMLNDRQLQYALDSARRSLVPGSPLTGAFSHETGHHPS